MHRLQIQLAQDARTGEINIGGGLRHDLGRFIESAPLINPQKVALLSNARVSDFYGRDVRRSLKQYGFKVFQWSMPEGERYKSFRTLERAIAFLAENSFERTDVVVALGGGVVGDLAGFSAAIYLRGIPLVQVPTTLLAQIDSSVGGKTGINLSAGKNLVGAFHQAVAVVIDTETLSTLPPRELVAGSCEMVKQALIASRQLFDKTVKFLSKVDRQQRFFATPELEELIADHCSFKNSIVTGDEREASGRLDARSRKVLNLGHTTAHALETITNYRVFRHGEAVGYGLLVAGEISKNLGLLDSHDLQALQSAVKLCGPLPPANNLDIKKIMRAVKHDKKNVRGEVNWVLLEGIGAPTIIPSSEINQNLLRVSLRAGLQSLAEKKE